MEAWTRKFLDHADEIERLRGENLVFAEICRDYETLLGLLPCAADDPILPDIHESLTGLEQEIRGYLSVHSKGPRTYPSRETGQPKGSET
ncbi:hypothetical protein [Tropicimonas marinistellae]|uniref:hypothetical protein n=1 Tax=Tropicimonas marinistellae TaxID=1739787 RepID=UPI000829A0F5|nr:hypothetical protein [Tropicimonas marinistellae]